MTIAFEDALSACADATQSTLETLLPGLPNDRLRAAMRYAALDGGKRLRPFLVLQSAAIFDVSESQALRVGAALECVHCYSLVHDDLPAMDDDDLRRGRPTTHRQFDEATAILTGDALLTQAFAILADPATHPDANCRAALVAALAHAAGDAGMCGGQMRDIEAETTPLDADGILAMQALKTGALFEFACIAGALLGGGSHDDTEALRNYARCFGITFQIADDLLDEEADPEQMGKATGKDRERGKATLPALWGIEETRRRMNQEVEAGIAALARFDTRAAQLENAIRFAADRRS